MNGCWTSTPNTSPRSSCTKSARCPRKPHRSIWKADWFQASARERKPESIPSRLRMSLISSTSVTKIRFCAKWRLARKECLDAVTLNRRSGFWRKPWAVFLKNIPMFWRFRRWWKSRATSTRRFSTGAIRIRWSISWFGCAAWFPRRVWWSIWQQTGFMPSTPNQRRISLCETESE